MFKYLKSMKKSTSIMLFLSFVGSCSDPTSLGIKNPHHFKYSKEEITRATILSIAAKLEKKYHTDQNQMAHDSDDVTLSEKSKQIDFLRRIKENE